MPAAALRAVTLGLLVLLAGTASARAGAVIDRIRAEKAIHCAATERPGLLDRHDDGTSTGLLVDLCRAVGTVVAGPDIRVILDDPDAAALRAGLDDLDFLTGEEIVDDKLADVLLPGPPVFYETSSVMVVAGSPAQKPADLAGQPICFLEGDPAARHLQAWFAARHLGFVHMGYQEDVEMYDAFDAQRCHAVAGEATYLAAIRLDGGPNRRDARLLAETMATVPLIAATGTADGTFAALVGWTIATLQNADRPAGDWAAGGVDTLPLVPVAAGVGDDWQRRLLQRSGSYAAMLKASVGGGSPLRLAPGLNALAGAGGLLQPPDAR